MPVNVPNVLTILRIASIPILVVVFYLPFAWSGLAAATLFIVAGVTDWLDGFLARRLGQQSLFGAFLDPVADKLMVATALVVLVGDREIQTSVVSPVLFTVMAGVIIGREVVVSALREWMAELGKRASVAVSIVGKIKTVVQFTAISMLLYRSDIGGLSMTSAGEFLLYAAGGLTIWSMFAYLRAAWPSLVAHSAPAERGGRVEDAHDSAT